jgi:hypothetical protein
MTTEDKYTRLASWLRQNGAVINSNLIISGKGTDRSLRTLTELAPMTDMATIPRKCTINGPPPGGPAYTLLKELGNPDSFFKPYLDTLPTLADLASHPLYQFSSSDLPEMERICPEGAAKWKLINNGITAFVQNFINDPFIPASVRTEEMLRYASIIVLTRSWKDIGMVPFIDMMQHVARNETVSNLVVTDDNISVKCLGAKPGDELTIVYRTGSVADLYISYGIPVLSMNYVAAPLELPKLTDEYKEVLTSNGFGQLPLTILLTEADLIVNSIRQARILTCTPEQLKDKPDGKKTISLENDRAALAFLYRVAKEVGVNFKPPGPVHVRFAELAKVQQRSADIIKDTIEVIEKIWLSYIRV